MMKEFLKKQKPFRDLYNFILMNEATGYCRHLAIIKYKNRAKYNFPNMLNASSLDTVISSNTKKQLFYSYHS